MEEVIETRKNLLEEAGFLPSEVRVLSAISLSSPSMRRYITARKRLRAEMRRAKQPKKAQTAHIRFMYKAEGFYNSKTKKLETLERYTRYAAERVKPIAVRLPRGILRGMTSEQRQVYRGWIRADFLPWEAKELTIGHGGVKVASYKVYDSQPGRDARVTRREWVNDLRARGWLDAEIRREIANSYARERKTPFDLIKDEYDFKGHRPTLAEYKRAVARRRARRAAGLPLKRH